MLALDDLRWNEFEGGYRIKYNPSVALANLEKNTLTPTQIWDELWENLHHQGNVGIASYAAVPHLARIIRNRQLFDNNGFAMVVVIELARGKGKNPELPLWLKSDYAQALWDITKYGLENLQKQWDACTLQSILALLAILKNNQELAELIFEIEPTDAKMLLDKYFDL